ncbi:MAG: hypothetical protein HY042_10810 [Spirochaetia bacterium]|nr:hypothetical protein [Spirochaetia bacterium]
MDPFTQDRYFARKQFFKIFGGAVRIFSADKSQLFFYVKQKAFKLKEDITVFADESQNRPLLRIQARSILDFGATYDVTDIATNQRVGAVRRKFFRSFIRDTWILVDANDNEFGTVIEDSMLMALLRRFLSALIPQHYALNVGDAKVGDLKQTWNPFLPQFHVDFSMDTSHRLDRRLGIAAVVLLQLIEGKQKSAE